MRPLTRRFATAVLAALALLALPALASAQETERISLSSGVTLLELDAATAGVLAENGVVVTTTGAAEGSEDAEGVPTFSFPISFGTLDAESLGGLVVHRGGLEISAGDASVRARRFIIDTAAGELSALVSGVRGRVPLLDLDLSAAAPLVRPAFVLVDRVRATLSETAAGALNEALGTDLLTAGLSIGTAQVFGVRD